jgi:hypothetical protein
MRLLKLNEVVLEEDGKIYRQGRLQAACGTLVMTAVLLAFPVFLFSAGAPWPAWLVASLPAAFLVPLVLGNFLATLRKTNWLLWVRDDGLWINCRSYQDRSGTDHGCVVVLDYAEIARAARYAERYTTPRPRGGSTHYSLQALEIELAEAADFTPLKAALEASRTREQPVRSLLGMRMRSRPTHFPVCLPEPGRIRIYWRGGIGHWVAPSLARAIRDLGAHVAVGEPARRDRGDWRKLTGVELDEQILSLVESGAKFDAMRLLVKRRGYSETEARQFVDELTLSSNSV